MVITKEVIESIVTPLVLQQTQTFEKTDICVGVWKYEIIKGNSQFLKIVISIVCRIIDRYPSFLNFQKY